MNLALLDPKTWRKEALAHALWLLEHAGSGYAIRAADEAEAGSDGVLVGLGARVRKEVEKRREAANVGI